MDINNTPALSPPEGKVSNLGDAYSVHYIQTIISSIALFLSTSAVAIRTYTRAMVLKQFDTTDWALLFGLASMVALFGVSICTGYHGQGKHQWNVSIADVLQLQDLVNIIEILYNPLTFSVKYVILRQIESIFFSHRRDHIANRFLWALIWGNFILYTILLFLFIFACVPRAKISNPKLPGRCINTFAAFIASGALNLVSDITIIILPIVVIYRLQRPTKAKLGPIVIFSFGIL
ncbi:hypothetical protein F4678DRAFT_455406 [Xylaria arbuscula]|nr:hypothetical protein F4678DRAFT_455406 [Xylaria arbuscula]